MARIQVVTAITLNGFLPETADTLMSWIRTDKQGFPYWHNRCSAFILPHSILDLLCEKDRKDDSFIYLAKSLNRNRWNCFEDFFIIILSMN